MGFPTCVIRQNNHLLALAELSVLPEKPVFPTVVNCPICQQNTLHVFDDAATEGVWLHCTGCGTHGDIITFGAAVWNISLPETILKFSELKLLPEEAVDRQIAEYLKFYREFLAAEVFVEDAKTQIWTHGDDLIACRLRDWGVYQEINKCYGLVGVSTHDQIAKICKTLGRSKPTQLREDGPSVVFPFYDLPGRLTGFLLLQYNQRLESRQNFVPTIDYKVTRPEAGYFGLNLLLDAATLPINGHQFISDDVTWVLRAQCASLRHRFSFLPVFASYGGPEANSRGFSWAAMPPAKRIFYSSTYTPELISRACNAKGYVSVRGPHFKHRARATDDARFLGRLKDMLQGADTWQTALTKTLNTQTEIAATAFCERLTVPHDKLHTFLTKLGHKFSDGFADRVLTSTKRTIAAPTRLKQKWAVIERDSGWWTHTGLPISNVKPTVKKIIQSDTGARLYVVEALIAGTVFTFTESATIIERVGLFKYLATQLGLHNKVVLYDSRWNLKSHLLAMRMHTPELVPVSSRLGWDAAANAFRFSRYEISAGGEVRQTPQIPDQPRKDNFPEPHTAAPKEIHDFLAQTDSAAFTWSVTAHILANLLAPIAGKQYASVALTAENFDAASAIGASLGCRLEQTTAIKKNTVGGSIEKFTADNQWPLFILNIFNDSIFSRVIPRYHLHPIFIRTTRQCAAAAASYGWQTIPNRKEAGGTDYSALKYVIPNYIQDKLRNRMQLLVGAQNITDAVLIDLHSWLATTYGSAFNLEFARRIIYNSSNAHELLKIELKDAIAQNKIAVLPHPRKRNQAANYFVRHQHAWWLNRRAVDNYFHAARSTPINWLGVIQLLRQNNLVVKEETINNMLGIWVPSFWGDELFCDSSPPQAIKTG
jgi:hypothetical protein